MSDRLCNWKEQTDFVLKKCAEKLNGLKVGGKLFPFKRRLESAKAIHLSKMYFGVEVWGPGLVGAQVQVLQACQNRVVQWVVGRGRQGPNSTRENLKACGLLSVNQTIAFRVLITGLQVLQTGKPEGLKRKLVGERKEGTRVSRRCEKEVRNETVGHYQERSWANFFINLYGRLPERLKTVDVKSRGGKVELRQWVEQNIGLQIG